MCVGVALEPQSAVFRSLGNQPHLTGATADAVFLGSSILGQSCEITTKVDDVAIALFPVSEELEGFGEFFNGVIDRAGGRGVQIPGGVV